MLAFRVREEQNAEVPQGARQRLTMRLAMKTFNRIILGAHGSALLLSGFVLCNFALKRRMFLIQRLVGGQLHT